MDLELLQQALMVKVDHKQLYQAISECNEHLKIDVPTEALCLCDTYKVIKERCYQWYEGLK